jgi:hypothetical protein
MAVLIYFSPKIKDISNDLVFKNYNHEFNFPSLPDKITDEINISSDLSKIDLSNNDFLKY